MHEPLPALREEVANVGKVFLAGRGVDDCLNRDAKEGQSKDEDEGPEYGL